ncbi:MULTISPECIES: hypothetical protein [unclassified Sphingomonas]|jgi:hypothetical protein|uniref:hypothetical protein n=1 Tax=unclassified Sphingomonas TaxID=196159 RepID=UPI000AC3D33D|nr:MULTISPECIES: hypothetical protein [unclassified Sphingomonas]
MMVTLIATSVLVAAPVLAQSSPPPVIVRSVSTDAREIAPYEVEIDVRGGDAPLWSGTLFVTGRTPSSYSSELREADRACGGEAAGRDAQTQKSLRVMLRNLVFGESSDRVQLDVTWTRPGTSCPAVRQTVTIGGQVDLPPQSVRELRGDGGLRVTIRRR